MAGAVLQKALATQAKGDFAGSARIYRALLSKHSDLLARRTVSGRMITGPDFLIIGAPRSGTSWLKLRLAEHPAIRIMAGEPHYFSYHATGDPRLYIRSFVHGSVKNPKLNFPGHRIYGEKSPSYLALSDDRIALAAALFPGVRLICLVRDPVQRAWSHLKLHGVGHDHRSQTYTEALEAGRYAAGLARWGRHFPASRFLLLDFDRIRTDPARVFAETLAHIGAPPLDLDFPPAPDQRREDAPAELRTRLEDVYRGERWDLPYLRDVLETAAAGLSPTA